MKVNTDPLFIELLKKMDELLEIGHDALTGEISEFDKINSTSDEIEMYKKIWRKYLVEMTEKRRNLEQTINTYDINTEEGKNIISRELAFWRGICRRLSEGGDPEWSANYETISNLFDDIVGLVEDIDDKYLLGQHIMLASWKKYHPDIELPNYKIANPNAEYIVKKKDNE